ncbi:MAG: hypothetical protein KME54_28940 [Tolypothrix brevis GSE-NOS-MK-07-07A]|nr:hypothetical protein [Tolypothrix brevis GSE-NOS-MK-07-07A]MBW4480757.1 hypothetical protein [Tolypothrix brevis GSE-NOS-MK-07-07A]
MSKSNGILNKSKLILLAENTEMSKSNGILNKSKLLLLIKFDFSHKSDTRRIISRYPQTSSSVEFIALLV